MAEAASPLHVALLSLLTDLLPAAAFLGASALASALLYHRSGGIEPLRAIAPRELWFLRSLHPSLSDKELLHKVEAVHHHATRKMPREFLYKCVRGALFLEPRGAAHFAYNRMVARAAETAQGALLWVDLGCGMGSDIQKAVVDGWPAERTAAIDITDALWKVGSLLYGPHPCQIVLADMTATPSPPSIAPLVGRAAVVSATAVLHTLDEDGVGALLANVCRLLAPGSGCFLGSTVGALSPTLWGFAGAAGSTRRFLHSAASLKLLLQAKGFSDITVETTQREPSTGVSAAGACDLAFEAWRRY